MSQLADHTMLLECPIANAPHSQVAVKLTGSDTDGAFSLVEYTSLPGTDVMQHMHTREDKTFIIQAGVFEFLINGETIIAKAGATIDLPMGVRHGFRTLGTSPCVALIVAAPAGFEYYFHDFSDAIQQFGLPLPAAALAQLNQAYGIIFEA